MRPGARPFLPFLISCLIASPVAAAEERVDLATIHRIKTEAFQGKVMDHLFMLTDVNGPRLSNSPGFRRAALWSVGALKGWGAAGPRLEPWGTFGRGWELRRFSAHMLEPAYAPLAGMPKAWSSGTQGPITGPVVAAPFFATEEERDDQYSIEKLTARVKRYKAERQGTLRGKIVLLDPSRDLTLPTKPAGERYAADALAEIARAPEPIAWPPLEYPLMELPADRARRELFGASMPVEVTQDFWLRQERVFGERNAFLRDEKALAILTADRRGDGGIVFAEEAGPWETGAPVPPPMIALAPEAYGRIARLVEKKVPVTLQIDVDAVFHDDAPEGVNVIAEIPGGGKRDEVVMLGAHLDSWHGGTGATDNAAGCAVVLEALRILKALDLRMDRTVRLALWSGEEQALYGSRGYVRNHFADALTMTLKPEHARLAAYFNVDNGTGKIRGVYLQGNDMVRPIFAAWLLPFRDLGADTLSISDTGGTDHQSFDQVGLPGFQFIQDPMDYETRTHHSNMDVYDHAHAADLMQASAILASFVYHAATRPEMLPREPLPKPINVAPKVLRPKG